MTSKSEPPFSFPGHSVVGHRVAWHVQSKAGGSRPFTKIAPLCRQTHVSPDRPFDQSPLCAEASAPAGTAQRSAEVQHGPAHKFGHPTCNLQPDTRHDGHGLAPAHLFISTVIRQNPSRSHNTSFATYSHELLSGHLPISTFVTPFALQRRKKYASHNPQRK